jgi:hypothetical protein
VSSPETASDGPCMEIIRTLLNEKLEPSHMLFKRALQYHNNNISQKLRAV